MIKCQLPIKNQRQVLDIINIRDSRRIYTSGLHMRFPHWIAIFYYWPWLSKTKVSYKKLQCSVVNACRNRKCKLSFIRQCFLLYFIARKIWCFLWRITFRNERTDFANFCSKVFLLFCCWNWVAFFLANQV